MNRTEEGPWGRPGSSNPGAQNGAAFPAASRGFYHERGGAGIGVPVFAATAKGWLPVGRVVERDGVRLFRKEVDSRRHRLHSPPAYALEEATLNELVGALVEVVEVRETDSGRVLRAPLRAFAERGVAVHRGGFDRQVALPLARWQVEDPRQGVLFRAYPKISL